MKKSELKEIIKASFLEEAADSTIAEKKEDDVKEAMRGKFEEDDVKEMMRGGAYEEDDVKEEMTGDMEEDDVKEMMRGDMEEDDLKEQEDVDVDVDEKEDIDVDIEKDVDVDDVSKESDIEVKSEVPGESSDVAAILGLLTKAQERAEGMGDEKLLDQIGNTITYYTRAHVVKSGDVMEAKDEEVKEEMKDKKMEDDVKEEMKDKKMEDDVKEELTEEVKRFKKLAGLIK